MIMTMSRRLAILWLTIATSASALVAPPSWPSATSSSSSSSRTHRSTASLRLLPAPQRAASVVKDDQTQSATSSTSRDVLTVSTRSDFLTTTFLAVGAAATTSLVVAPASPAHARGRATLEQQYDRYAPRIRAGGTFYATELKKLVAAADFVGVAAALAEPPTRQKSDLTQPDAGVAARARQAGQFSDARVLVAADLWAASFSESSFSAKTKKMQEAVGKVRDVVEEMQKVARLGSGEEKSGGLFGLGAKKVDKNECAKKLRDLYVQGGNAWNEYILASNDNLPLQFERFEFIK